MTYTDTHTHTHTLAPATPSMDDMHAPTVTSGPTSSGHSNGVPKEQLTLQELMAEKDRVEAELKALGQVLDSVRTASTSPGHGHHLIVGCSTAFA